MKLSHILLFFAHNFYFYDALKFKNCKSATVNGSFFSFKYKDWSNRLVDFKKYKGNILLVVNVATFCGLTTSNFLELNALVKKYSREDGCSLNVIAFPSNQVFFMLLFSHLNCYIFSFILLYFILYIVIFSLTNRFFLIRCFVVNDENRVRQQIAE